MHSLFLASIIMARTLSICFLTLTILGQAIGQATPPEPDDGQRSFDDCPTVDDAALFKPMGEIRTSIHLDGKRMPPDCAERFFTSQSPADSVRFGSESAFHWMPTNFFHMPTYFDDVPLERYGQTRHEKIQPFVSGAKFALQLPVLSYKMGLDRPHACISTLGHRPPGDCVPCIRQTLPLQSDATFVQAAATVGFIFMMP